MLLLAGGAQAPAMSDSLPAWLVAALSPQPDDPLDRPPAARLAARRAALLERRLDAADAPALLFARASRRRRRALKRRAWDLLGVAQAERVDAPVELVARMKLEAMRLLQVAA